MPNQSILAGHKEKAAVAQEFDVCERTIDRWCDEPDGKPCIRVGRKKYFSVESVRAWLIKRETRRNPRRPRGRLMESGAMS